MEYEETSVSPLYHPLISSGQALGASRWLASLQRQCEYLAIVHCNPISAFGDTGESLLLIKDYMKHDHV
jgi:homeobox-leucine zipper protein